MADLTTDRNDPRLGRGSNSTPGPQNEAYLVLSDEELAQGFVRPVRRTYVHRYMLDGTVVPIVLRSEPTGGCGAATTMPLKIAQTYARDPKFYGATYCVGCKMHLPVSQFHWDDDFTTVGS